MVVFTVQMSPTPAAQCCSTYTLWNGTWIYAGEHACKHTHTTLVKGLHTPSFWVASGSAYSGKMAKSDKKNRRLFLIIIFCYIGLLALFFLKL